MAKRRQDPRAKKSGFARQLLALFHENELAWRSSRVSLGPTNPTALSKWMTSRGEPLSPRTAIYWADGINLPGSNYVALLEELLGAPWIRIDDPKTALVMPEERAQFLSAYAGNAASRERAALALKHAMRPARRG